MSTFSSFTENKWGQVEIPISSLVTQTKENTRSDNNIDCTEICNDQTTHLTDCSDYTKCLYDYNLHKIGELWQTQNLQQ